MKRTASVAAALLGVALVQPAVALAQEAPAAGDGSAEAVAAEVGGVIAAGETSARSASDDAEAEANALSIGGEPPSEQFGGKVGPTSEDSDADGSLIDSGDTPLGRLQVTPWEARTRKSDGGCRTATGRAAVARLTLLSPEVAHVNVLQSESNAAHCGSSSRGRASSDGATVDLGDGALLLTLLHSEAATGEEAGSYLVGIGDNAILTSEQTGGKCSLELPGLLGLTCLGLAGDTAAGSLASDVATLSVGDGALTGTVVGSSGTPARAAAAPAVQSEQIAPAPSDDGSTRGGTLARTGLELGALGLMGANLTAAGALLRRRMRAR